LNEFGIFTCGFPVTLIEQDLRGNIIGRAHTRLRLPRVTDLCESEVAQFEVAFRVDTQVLGFQVAVNDIVAVEILEHQHHLSGIEDCLLVFQDYFVAHVGEEIAALDELKQEKHLSVIMSESQKFGLN
jgi:hypothetical protein